MNKVELSDEELYLLWIIACWFDAPVTSRLKHKLSGLADDRGRFRKFDGMIEQQLIKTGTWLAEYRGQKQ